MCLLSWMGTGCCLLRITGATGGCPSASRFSIASRNGSPMQWEWVSLNCRIAQDIGKLLVIEHKQITLATTIKQDVVWLNGWTRMISGSLGIVKVNLVFGMFLGNLAFAGAVATFLGSYWIGTPNWTPFHQIPQKSPDMLACSDHCIWVIAVYNNIHAVNVIINSNCVYARKRGKMRACNTALAFH